jgi:hypothetical protein
MRRFFYVERLWPFFPGLFFPARGLFPLARRKKPSHKLLLAESAIKAVCPDGVPDQTILPNKELCFQVAEWLEQQGHQEVSPTHILRAAGRREP